MTVLEEKQVIEGPKGTLYSKYLTRLPPGSSIDYRAWLFGQPHSLNKERLLELTLLAFPPEERGIIHFQMENSEESFKKILDQPLPKLPEVFFTQTSYTYEHPGHFYLIFADPSALGGHFRSWGNDQEELMFYEFPKLAHLNYAREGRAFTGPFLIPDLKREISLFHLEGDLLEKTSLEEIRAKIEYLDVQKQPSIHVLGIPEASLGRENINHHLLLRHIFLAFDGAKMFSLEKKPVIHTLSAGKTITLLLLLGATLAEVDIVFENMDHHPPESFLEEAKRLIAEKRNGADLLAFLVEKQKSDPHGEFKNGS